MSLAVPLTVTGAPGGDDRVGDVGREIGGVVSVEAPAGVRPACSVAGCTPMSANRFDRRLLHRGARRCDPPRSCVAVEAPRPLHGAGAEHERVRTAPFVSRYSVRWCVAVPVP